MTDNALKDYPLHVADSAEKFHGAQLPFFGWDQHLMFYAPLGWALPPTTSISNLMEHDFPSSFGANPDFGKIDIFLERFLSAAGAQQVQSQFFKKP